MRKYAVAGRPILHSRSPQIFNSYFRNHGPDSHYSRLAADSAEEAAGLFRELGLRGMNMTAPFKTDMIPLLDCLDPAAARIGSVNAIVRNGDALIGYNTDHLGVSGALARAGIRIDGENCLVIGAGGAGRAAVYALVRMGGKVTLLNRDLKKARRAAETLGCAAGPLGDFASRAGATRIFVMTIPPQALVLDGISFRKDGVLLDANYKDRGLETAAVEKALAYIPGIVWLQQQAIPALRLFADDDPDIQGWDPFQGLRADSPSGRDCLALIGFMGAGKSAVGRALASRLGYEFLDVDVELERREGISVREIFRARGEPYFRASEKEMMSACVLKKRIVLACGGGAVLEPETRTRLAEHCLTVWIHTPIETAFRRMDIGARPLLDHPQPFDRARELYNAREGFYFRCADLIVGNDRPLERTAEKIHEEIRLTL